MGTESYLLHLNDPAQVPTVLQFTRQLYMRTPQGYARKQSLTYGQPQSFRELVVEPEDAEADAMLK